MSSISYRVDTRNAILTEIVSGLYICGVSELTRQNITKYGITLIINATSEVPNLRLLGDVPRIKLWIDDVSKADIYSHLDLLSDQIEATISDGGKVLVHCVAGVSRSATVCLAFLTKYRCRSLRDAYHLMCSKRPLVRPNLGFWKQLITFEQAVKQAPSSVRLVADEAQPEKFLPDVYLKLAMSGGPESPSKTENSRLSRARNESPYSSQRFSFKPTLETLNEGAGSS